jgi:transposase-like protein
LWQRGLERVDLIVSDGAEGVVRGAATVYPAAAHPLCVAYRFRLREDLTAALDAARRRKLRREVWWIWEADDEGRLRRWATSFCRRPTDAAGYAGNQRHLIFEKHAILRSL